MRICIGLLTFSLLLFLAATAPCQKESAADTITGEEYEIYRLVIAKLEGRCDVDGETLAGIQIDPGELSARGIQVDRGMTEDFNSKNAKTYQLSAAFIYEMETGSKSGLEGRQKATFSRIGFEREKRRAVLIVGRTFYYAEDIMNEGQYVFLEQKGGMWMVAETAGAWPVQMGRIR